MSYRILIFARAAVLVLLLPIACSAADLTTDQVKEALRRAAGYWRDEVAVHGGYVYYYSLDLQHRFGEGVASPDQIWVEPPGTPTVGMAYLAAYDATGDSFFLDAAAETADALLYGQLESGGWTNCIDFDPQGRRVAQYRNGRGRGRNVSSLDDDQTQAALSFLIQADRACQGQRAAIREGVQIGLASLLRAQFDNGAFPQGWDGPVDANQPVIPASLPPYDWRTEGRIKNYWDKYTLNDGLASTVARVLIEAAEAYGDPRYSQAAAHLGDFLVLAQLPKPQPAWAQQYNEAMHPIWARKFEPPAIASHESQDVVEALLAIYALTGEDKYLRPIPPAPAYLRRSSLADGRLARYYELGSNRPLYMRRDGENYSLTYHDERLPSHYAWKVASRVESLERRYQTVRQKPPPMDRGMPLETLRERARDIVRNLDPQGRWVSDYRDESLVGGARFDVGQEYLSSARFSDHLETLSEYLRAMSSISAAR